MHKHEIELEEVKQMVSSTQAEIDTQSTDHMQKTAELDTFKRSVADSESIIKQH